MVSQDGRASEARATLYAAPPSRRLELRPHRADQRCGVLHSLGVRLTAHEAPPALLEPEARAQLLQRARHLSGPPPAGEGTRCELPAPLTILWSKRDGEACEVAPITVSGRQVLRPQLPRLDLCGVHLIPPDAAVPI